MTRHRHFPPPLQFSVFALRTRQKGQIYLAGSTDNGGRIRPVLFAPLQTQPNFSRVSEMRRNTGLQLTALTLPPNRKGVR